MERRTKPMKKPTVRDAVRFLLPVLLDRGTWVFVCLVAPLFFFLRYANFTGRELLSRVVASFAVALIVRQISFAGGKKLPLRILAGALSLALFNAALVLWIMEISSFALSGESFDFAFYFHMDLTTLRVGTDGYGGKLALIGAFLLAANAIILVLLCRKAAPARFGSVLFRVAGSFFAVAASLAALCLLDAAPRNFADMMLCYGGLAGEDDVAGFDPEELKSYRIKPCDVTYETLTAEPGKNIVFIYLESLERNFTHNHNFPGVLAETEKLMASPDAWVMGDFENKAGFTFASLYQTHTGLFMPGKFSSSRYNENIGDRLLSLSLILKKAGYYLNYIKGGSLEFAGTGLFLKLNGYDDVWCAGDEELEKYTGKLQKGAAYGFRDHTLFEAAYRRYCELSERERPFCLTMLTVDCHPPNGFTDEKTITYRMPDGSVYRLLCANRTTDHYLGEFVAKLRKHPKWKDTVVFVMTDHLMMTNLPAENERPLKPMLSETPRRLIGFAVNGAATGRLEAASYQPDVAPTLLALAGVKHNYVFPLGENLLGEVDPKRKKAFSPEGQRALERYIRSKTTLRELDLSSGFTLKERRGRWSLCSGRSRFPVYDAYSRPELPELEHNFVLCFGANGKELVSVSHVRDTEKLREIFDDDRNYHLILGGSYSDLFSLLGLREYEGGGRILAFGKRGQWKCDVKADPADLRLDDLFSPGMRLPEDPPRFKLSGIRTRIGKKLVFALKKHEPNLNLQHFSRGEKSGRWSDGKAAALTLEVKPDGKKYYVVFLALEPRKDKEKPFQKLGVVLPGGKREDFALAKGGELALVAEQKQVKDGRLKIEFEFPDAAPAGGGDRRLLGFFFKSLQLRSGDNDWEVFDFTRPGTLHKRESHGFEEEEREDGKWTTDKSAGFRISLPRRPLRNVMFRFNMEPMTNENVKHQRVGVVVDGKKRGEILCDRAGDHLLEIDASAFAGPDFRLELELPDASPPGNGDQRTLGVFLRKIAVRERE